MAPCQLSRQRRDNWLISKHLRKTHHVAHIFFTETAPKLNAQLSRQRRDNLFTVAGALALKHLAAHPLTNAPIHQRQAGVHRHGGGLAGRCNHLPQFSEQGGRVRRIQCGACYERRRFALSHVDTFFLPRPVAEPASRAARSARMRASSAPAGSSAGSCGTSWPEKAACRMFLRWAADCLSESSAGTASSLIDCKRSSRFARATSCSAKGGNGIGVFFKSSPEIPV